MTQIHRGPECQLLRWSPTLKDEPPCHVPGGSNVPEDIAVDIQATTDVKIVCVRVGFVWISPVVRLKNECERCMVRGKESFDVLFVMDKVGLVNGGNFRNSNFEFLNV